MATSNNQVHDQIMAWIDKQTPSTKAKIQAVLHLLEASEDDVYNSDEVATETEGLVTYNYLYRRAKTERPEYEPFTVEHEGPRTFRIKPKTWEEVESKGVDMEEEWTPERAVVSKEVMEVRVVCKEGYGVFCKMPDGNNALLHWVNMVSKGTLSTSDKAVVMAGVSVGDILPVRVSRIDRSGRPNLNLVNKVDSAVQHSAEVDNPLTPRMQRVVELLQGCCENGDILLSGKDKTEYHEDLVYFYNNVADFDLRANVIDSERNKVLEAKLKLEKELSALDDKLKVLEE